MSEHTATPWKLIGEAAWVDSCKDRGFIFECALRTGKHIPADQNKANAAYIVRACNSHEKLVAALRDVLSCLDCVDCTEGYVSPGDACGKHGDIRERITKALAEAGE